MVNRYAAICIACTHLRFGPNSGKCDACPHGIPEDIASGTFDHREPRKGDNGIRFKVRASGGGPELVHHVFSTVATHHCPPHRRTSSFVKIKIAEPHSLITRNPSPGGFQADPYPHAFLLLGPRYTPDPEALGLPLRVPPARDKISLTEDACRSRLARSGARLRAKVSTS
jgi:hypothetical protein